MLENWETERQIKGMITILRDKNGWLYSETEHAGGLGDGKTDKGYDNDIACQERMITSEDGNLTQAYRLSTAPTIQ
jgi:hypothetical protein